MMKHIKKTGRPEMGGLLSTFFHPLCRKLTQLGLSKKTLACPHRV